MTTERQKTEPCIHAVPVRHVEDGEQDRFKPEATDPQNGCVVGYTDGVKQPVQPHLASCHSLGEQR